jgi:hypothetical protein
VRALGMLTAAALTALAAVVVVLTVESVPDIRRYLAMRRM